MPIIFTQAIFLTILTIFSLCLAQSQTTSSDGTCGLSTSGTNTNITCIGSTWGNCCSSKGFCGGTTSYCGSGCQTAFGDCSANATLISADGSCGGSKGQICIGSTFGDCCSANGFCGSGDTYCGSGCQGGFGSCDDGGLATSSGTVVASTMGSMSAAGSVSTTMATTTTGTAARSATTTSGSSSTATSLAAQAKSRPVTDTAGFKAGMAVMAIALAAIIAGLVWFLLRRRSRQHQATQPSGVEGRTQQHYSNDEQKVDGIGEASPAVPEKADRDVKHNVYAQEMSAESLHELPLTQRIGELDGQERRGI